MALPTSPAETGGAAAAAAKGGDGWKADLLSAVKRVLAASGPSRGIPVPLLCPDREVLAIGRALLERQPGQRRRLSLVDLLEEACACAPKSEALAVLPADDTCPFPRVKIPEKEAPPAVLEAKALDAVRRRGSRSRSRERPARNVEGPPPLAARNSRHGGAPGAAGRSARGHEDKGKEKGKEKDKDKDRDTPGKGRERGKCQTFKIEELGVELSMVCGDVPVVTLEKGGVFDLNASCLLQNAMGTYSKADALYCSIDGVQEKRVMQECLRNRLADTTHELWCVHARGNKEVMAVGTCGKRSIMLSLACSLALHMPGPKLAAVMEDLEPLGLKEPFSRLVRLAQRMAGSGE